MYGYFDPYRNTAETHRQSTSGLRDEDVVRFDEEWRQMAAHNLPTVGGDSSPVGGLLPSGGSSGSRPTIRQLDEGTDVPVPPTGTISLLSVPYCLI